MTKKRTGEEAGEEAGGESKGVRNGGDRSLLNSKLWRLDKAGLDID